VSPGANLLIKDEKNTIVWRLPLELPGRREHGIVKLYRRRGVWNHWRSKVLQFRVQREFVALCLLTDAGVPCSLPLLWGWGLAPEHGHFELLVTREIPVAVNLREFLARGNRLRPSDLLPLFDSFRVMHARGLYHGALWPKNILLTKAADETWQFHLIDLARSLRFNGSISGTLMARHDLLRFLYTSGVSERQLACEKLLHRYGCTARNSRALAKRAHRFRSSRRVLDLWEPAFQVRAKIGGWRGLERTVNGRLARRGLPCADSSQQEH